MYNGSIAEPFKWYPSTGKVYFNYTYNMSLDLQQMMFDFEITSKNVKLDADNVADVRYESSDNRTNLDTEKVN